MRKCDIDEKKFRFRLQTVLDVANTREMLALEEFAAVTQKVSTERTTLQNLLRELDYTRNIPIWAIF